MESLLQGLSSVDIPFESFLSTCDNVLDKEAPQKKICERKSFAFLEQDIVQSSYVEN